MRVSREKALEFISKAKEASKQNYDASALRCSPKYKVGDMVYLKHHHRLRKALSPIWKGPFKIVKIIGKHNVTLLINRKHVKYHTNLLKQTPFRIGIY